MQFEFDKKSIMKKYIDLLDSNRKKMSKYEFDYQKYIDSWKEPYSPPAPPRQIRDYDDELDRVRAIRQQEQMQEALRRYVQASIQENVPAMPAEKEPEPAPTFEQRMGAVEYSMTDIESLFFALTLCISNPAERAAFETIFTNWKNDRLFAKDKKK